MNLSECLHGFWSSIQENLHQRVPMTVAIMHTLMEKCLLCCVQVLCSWGKDCLDITAAHKTRLQQIDVASFGITCHRNISVQSVYTSRGLLRIVWQPLSGIPKAVGSNVDSSDRRVAAS